ncbi:hypothetical protein [Peribacillus sp. NPDC058075]|uniref:hypothetical protein n=1 Tax=unclassified Peribacillus TaxID=2675266 RepID=UPI0036DA5CE5
MDSTFNGPFQTINYVYYPKKDNDHVAFPVTTININSTIQKPLDMEMIHTGKHLIKGIAWTGEGVLQRWKLVMMVAIHGETPIYYLDRILFTAGLVGHLNGLY